MSLFFQQIIERLENFWSNPHDWPPYQVVADLAIGLAKALKPVFSNQVFPKETSASLIFQPKKLGFLAPKIMWRKMVGTISESQLNQRPWCPR